MTGILHSDGPDGQRGARHRGMCRRNPVQGQACIVETTRAATPPECAGTHAEFLPPRAGFDSWGRHA